MKRRFKSMSVFVEKFPRSRRWREPSRSPGACYRTALANGLLFHLVLFPPTSLFSLGYFQDHHRYPAVSPTDTNQSIEERLRETDALCCTQTRGPQDTTHSWPVWGYQLGQESFQVVKSICPSHVVLNLH